MCGSIPFPVINIVTKGVVPPRKDSLCNFPVPPDLNVVIRSYELLSSPKGPKGVVLTTCNGTSMRSSRPYLFITSSSLYAGLENLRVSVGFFANSLALLTWP